jgi:hypothetical protein
MKSEADRAIFISGVSRQRTGNSLGISVDRRRQRDNRPASALPSWRGRRYLRNAPSK